MDADYTNPMRQQGECPTDPSLARRVGIPGGLLCRCVLTVRQNPLAHPGGAE